jgi:hypothetical protein
LRRPCPERRSIGETGPPPQPAAHSAPPPSDLGHFDTAHGNKVTKIYADPAGRRRHRDLGHFDTAHGNKVTKI